MASRPFSHRAIYPSVVLGAISVVALVLRLVCLDCYGLWYDEVASVEIAQRGVASIFTDRFGGMLVQTPLHYFMVWLASQPVDPAASAVLVRLPSALVGALAPLAVYALGKELFGRAQGLLAALLMALSAVHIGHSQDVRPYTMLVLFTTLSVYCLLVAARTGSTRWWVLFVVATAADLHISYFALTLYLPALSLYLLRLLYRFWRQRLDSSRQLRYALISLAMVAVAAVPIVLDVLRVHRTAPDWGRFPDIVGSQLALLFSRLSPLGIGGATEQTIHWGLFALAMLGTILGVRARRSESAMLCLALILVPGLLLAAFRTSNMVFQRYALFALPFYLLLISNGLAATWRLLADRKDERRRTKDERRKTKDERRKTKDERQITFHVSRFTFHVLSGGVGALVLLLFLFSLYIYFSPALHSRLSSQPDYRGAAQYLSEVAGPGDLIILADEPALGMAVVNFYWRGEPPAPVYDARDPLLPSQPVSGSIYWVVSFFQNDPRFHPWLAGPGQGWADSRQLERLVVLKEGAPRDTLSSMEGLVRKLEAANPGFMPVRTLRAGILQAGGDVEGAAAIYRSVGAYYPQLGGEFLATAQGFAERGNPQPAWREALTSKFMQPGNPALHRLLSQQLREAEHISQSLVEAQIAEALERAR